MIKIYAMAYQDRSDRVRWLLEEMGVPYENIFLNKKAGELTSPEYLKLNPMGRVPTVIDGGQVVFESVGITLYLADKYGLGTMAPQLTDAERANYLQWMVFSVGSLECVVARMFAFAGKSESEVEKIKLEVAQQCEILRRPLVRVLSQQPYLLASGFSAADIMMGAIIPGAAEYLCHGEECPIQRYMDLLKARPAAIRAKDVEVVKLN